MALRWIALATVALLASQEAKAACVIHGARPTAPLPTMLSGQEFSFIASPDCETLRFTIRGTTVSKMPQPGEPVGPGPHTYKVVLTEREWDAAVAYSGPTLTWVVIGRTSAGVTTRMVTTNDLKSDERITIDLSMADAKLMGEEEDDHAGDIVSGAGDVNSDGSDDLLIGTWAGAAYLVLGPITGTLDLSHANAKLVGEEAYDSAGYSVAGAGDVDSDGNDDVLVGAPYGTAYLVSGPVTGTFDLSLADAKLVGEAPDDDAWRVSGAGDVDGDGHDDVLVGAYNNDEGGYHAGAAYLVLGPVTGTIDLSLADAKLVGEESGDTAGAAVSGAGDVDGDGHPDLLVSATENDEGGRSAGAAYLVLGPVSGTVDLSAADAKLVGERRNDRVGEVAGAGDVDGDGDDDLLVGAVFNDEGALDAGAAYLVLGPVTGTLDLVHANAKLVGEEDSDWAGASVSGAGDVDGDGHDDLLLGAPGADDAAGDAGAAYVVLGPVTGAFDLTLADVKLVGEKPTDWAGNCVAGAGDVDGDGHDDVLIGAPYARGPADSSLGAAYLIYGGGL